MAKNILLIDDEQSIIKILTLVLENADFKVDSASNYNDSIKKLNSNIYDLVICDLMMDNKQAGIEILKNVKQISPETEIIIMTGYASVESAVAAMKLGAFHYLQKPINNDELLTFVNRALEHKRLLNETKQLKERLYDKFSFSKIIGNSKGIKEAIRLATLAASVDSAVLITGETGTGKELIAQAIHNSSARKNKSFVALNCAAVPENLLESELFGYVKGAFTGAVSNHKGLFETADEGTFFLDEIGEMPLLLQTKLLRVLQNFEIKKLGDTKSIKVNVRIIASTNKNLEEEIKLKKFREDLYYRLNVIKINLPRLSDRVDDIPILINHFAEQFSKKYTSPKITFSPQALEILMNYDYPGNIRELENIIERTLIFNKETYITPELLPPLTKKQTIINKANDIITEDTPSTLKEVEAISEKNAIIQAIKKCDGNLNLAANALNIGRTTLWRKMKKYNLVSKKNFR